MNLIDDYLIDRKKCSELQDEHEEKVRKITDKDRKQCNEIRDKIWELNTQERKIKEQHRKELDEEREQYSGDVAILYRTKKILYNIIDYLSLDKNKEAETLELGNIRYDKDRIHYYENHTQAKEDLGYLYESKHLKVKAFIVSNRKPKNCYALIAVFSVSDTKLLGDNWKRSYLQLKPSILRKSNNDLEDVCKIIQEDSDIQKLKNYLSNKKRKNMVDIHDIIDNIILNISEFQAIKREYTLKDVADLRVITDTGIAYKNLTKNKANLLYNDLEGEQQIVPIELEGDTLLIHKKKEEVQTSPVTPIENYFCYKFPLKDLLKIKYVGELAKDG